MEINMILLWIIGIIFGMLIVIKLRRFLLSLLSVTIKAGFILSLIVCVGYLIWFLLYDNSSEFENLVRIDPIPHTSDLIKKERYVEASDYLSYFMDYEYVSQNSKAIVLQKEIDTKRQSYGYKLKKVWEGITKGESDEIEGQAAAIASDFVVIGDIRDIAKESKNWIEGKDVNQVTVALAAIGAVATGATLLTGGTSASSKPALSFMKIANKAGKMPKWLGNFLIEGAKITKQTGKISHVTGLFDNIHDLYKNCGTLATLELLGKSKDVNNFKKLAKFGSTFGKRTGTLLKIAGDEGINAYHTIGNVSKNTFLEAATFGPDGIKALEKRGVKNFENYLIKEKATSTARRRMTTLEKEIVESGRKTRFSGQDFIKRNDLFDSKYVDATGKSNLDRMRQGLAPIGKDGNSINLHHMKQQNNGVISEVSKAEHIEYSDIFHRYASKNESEIDRAAFDKLRSAYWQERAKDFN